MLTFINSFTKKKELFSPSNPPKVRMYVCGITPYAPAHIGHGRCYVTFDLVFRLLTFLGYHVDYCRNITDIDDKLLKKAVDEFGDAKQFTVIADRYITEYRTDMKLLNCLTPTYEPRVTAHIPEIISFIQNLIQKGIAYQSNGDVYFAVREFPGYGKLSKRKLDDMRAGERVDIREEKKDPLDFALWKHEPEITFWQSPWGNGRPGWHIECSALAYTYLGQHLDIHGGGLDLMFPHHENEIAQSEARFNGSFARFWLHNGFVQVNNEKMSKSLGNVINLDALFKEIDPMVLRYYYLSHQYRMPIDFSEQTIRGLEKSYERLCNAFLDVQETPVSFEQAQHVPVIDHMLSLLCDDLNTPGMFGVLFESLDRLKKHENEAARVKYILTKILGLTLHPLEQKKVQITPEIQAILDEREHARAQKDWKRADELRDQLIKMGIPIQDKKV